MNAVKVTAAIVGGLIVLGAVVLGIRSIPDLRRYLRIRRM